MNAFHLKILAILAMVIDHLGWVFLDDTTDTAQVVHTVGRITLPIMCFLLVEGFHHTRNREKYAQRLFLFALISQLPYFFTISTTIGQPIEWAALLKGNILFNLLFAVIALAIMSCSLSVGYKTLAIVAITIPTIYMDWGMVPILITITLYACREKREWLTFSYLVLIGILLLLPSDTFSVTPLNFTLTNWFSIGMVIPLIFIRMYNGERGSNFGGRYFFYIFYPVHLVAIYLLSLCLFLYN